MPYLRVKTVVNTEKSPVRGPDLRYINKTKINFGYAIKILRKKSIKKYIKRKCCL